MVPVVATACGHSQAMPEGDLADLSKEYISDDLENGFPNNPRRQGHNPKDNLPELSDVATTMRPQGIQIRICP